MIFSKQQTIIFYICHVWGSINNSFRIPRDPACGLSGSFNASTNTHANVLRYFRGITPFSTLNLNSEILLKQILVSGNKIYVAGGRRDLPENNTVNRVDLLNFGQINNPIFVSTFTSPSASYSVGSNNDFLTWQPKEGYFDGMNNFKFYGDYRTDNRHVTGVQRLNIAPGVFNPPPLENCYSHLNLNTASSSLNFHEDEDTIRSTFHRTFTGAVHHDLLTANERICPIIPCGFNPADDADTSRYFTNVNFSQFSVIITNPNIKTITVADKLTFDAPVTIENKHFRMGKDAVIEIFSANVSFKNCYFYACSNDMWQGIGYNETQWPIGGAPSLYMEDCKITEAINAVKINGIENTHLKNCVFERNYVAIHAPGNEQNKIALNLTISSGLKIVGNNNNTSLKNPFSYLMPSPTNTTSSPVNSTQFFKGFGFRLFNRSTLNLTDPNIDLSFLNAGVSAVNTPLNISNIKFSDIAHDYFVNDFTNYVAIEENRGIVGSNKAIYPNLGAIYAMQYGAGQILEVNVNNCSFTNVDRVVCYVGGSLNTNLKYNNNEANMFHYGVWAENVQDVQVKNNLFNSKNKVTMARKMWNAVRLVRMSFVSPEPPTVVIENNEIYNITRVGIQISQYNGARIFNNIITLGRWSGNNVPGVVAPAVQAGIYLERANNADVENNQITQNQPYSISQLTSNVGNTPMRLRNVGIYATLSNGADIGNNTLNGVSVGQYYQAINTGLRTRCNIMHFNWHGIYYDLATIGLLQGGPNMPNNNMWRSIRSAHRMAGIVGGFAPIEWYHQGPNDVNNQFSILNATNPPIPLTGNDAHPNQSGVWNCTTNPYLPNPGGGGPGNPGGPSNPSPIDELAPELLAMVDNSVWVNGLPEENPEADEAAMALYLLLMQAEDEIPLMDPDLQLFYQTNQADLGVWMEQWAALNTGDSLNLASLNTPDMASMAWLNLLNIYEQSLTPEHQAQITNPNDLALVQLYAALPPHMFNGLPITARIMLGLLPEKATDNDALVNPDELVAVSGEITGQLICYPNPASDFVYLQLTQIDYPSLIVSLTDMQGKQLMQQNIALNNGSFPVSVGQLASGIYLLQVQLPNGERLMQKIVVNR